MSSNTGTTTNRYYYHTNHLGSIVALTNHSGNTVQTYSYDSFGRAYIVNGSGTGITPLDSYTGTLYSNTRLYTGREYDKELQLYYLRARYYNPDTGRFISRDPIGQNDQINLYTYVANSPVNYVDRMGREKALILVGVDWKGSFLGYGLTMTTLDLAAEIQYKKYIEQGYKPENIIGQRVKDINDVNKYILSDKYKDIALVAHSNSNSISLTYNALNPLQTINKDTVQYLRKVANKNVTLTIDGCLSGAGPNPIAKQIASHMDLTVKAPDSILNVANGDEFYDDGNEVLSKLSVKFWKQNIESLIAKNPANFITFQ